MQTKLISFMDFRQNLPKIWKELADVSEPKRYLVMVHNKPVLEVRPSNVQLLKVEKLLADVEAAKKSALVNYKDVFRQYGI